MRCLLSMVNHACRQANAYVEGDAKTRRQITQKRPDASPSKGKGKDATFRVREARRAAICARTVWVLLHAALITVAVMYGSELKTAWATGNAVYLSGLFGLLLINTGLYITASSMDPGFQPPMSNGDSRRWPALEDLADPTVGRDSDWLLQGRSGMPGTEPQSMLASARRLIYAPASSPLPSAAVRTDTAAGPNGPEALPASSATTASSSVSSGPAHRGARSRAPATTPPPSNGPPAINEPGAGDALALDVQEQEPSGRVCSYCGAWQPLRTKHCHDSDRCVRLFDHYCVWLGNCVGVRNYRIFYMYLLTQTACLLWGLKIFASGIVAVGSVAPRARPNSQVRSQLDVWVELHLPLLAGCSSMVLLLLLVASLAFYHSYLIATNQTSHEVLKGSKGIHYLKDLPDGATPFSRGLGANCWAFLCQGNWGEDNVMLPLSELQTLAARETFWNNRHYSCFD